MITSAPNEDPKTTWPEFKGPIDHLPRSRTEAYQVFGDPRERDAKGNLTGRPDLAWVKKNIIELHGKTSLPGVPTHFYFKIHRLAEPYAREGCRRAQIIAPDYKIIRAGGWVYRHIRHDTPAKAKAEGRKLRDLSNHALGCAIDFNAEYNRGIQFKRRGDVPELFSPAWRKTWPRGMPPEFVEAFRSVGFWWGGDFDGDGDSQDQLYVDPMHVALAPG